MIRAAKRVLDWVTGRAGAAAPAILMYHRVACPRSDPWSIAVKPSDFNRHMRYLRRFRHPMALPDFIEKAVGGRLSKYAVAVTFDDGYADNLIVAKPILEEFGIPATLFLTTNSIGQTEEFWWDELAKLFLEQPRSIELAVTIQGQDYRWWLVGDAAAVTRGDQNNLDAYREVWSVLRGLHAPLRAEAMSQLRRQADPVLRHALDRSMTETEIRQWLEGGLTRIAGHTASHPALRDLSAEARHQEIAQSLARCEQLMPGGGTGFAYPYGDRDAEVAMAAQQAGAKWACSTRRALLGKADEIDLFDLPRLQVHNGGLASQLLG